MKNFGHRKRIPLPTRRAGAQLLSPFYGQSIEFCSTTVPGKPPPRGDKSSMLKAVEGGVQRAILELQDLVGCPANPFRDAEAVHRLPRQRLQNHDIDGAFEQVEVGGFACGG